MITLVPPQRHPDGASDQVARLAAIALADLEEALGWLGRGPLRRAVRALGRRAALRFAEEVVDFDRRAAREGLVAAARTLLARHTGAVAVWGRSGNPHGRPLIFVANHPGLTDALALVVAVADEALTLVAADRPFFRATPNVSARLIPVPTEEAGRLVAFRAILGRIAASQPVATFPSGAIEPDPLLHADAFALAPGWTRQLAALKRRVPDLAIVPVAIGGVLTRRALRHPLARLHRSRTARERAAAMLQVVHQPLRPKVVRVAFGESLLKVDPESLADTYRQLNATLRADSGWSIVLE